MFYCLPSHQDEAYASGTVLHEIMQRRFGKRKERNWLYKPTYDAVPSIIPVAMKRGEAKEYCERLIRSQIVHNGLLFNSDCKIVLSQNELALEALGVAVWAGKTVRPREPEPRPHGWRPIGESYH